MSGLRAVVVGGCCVLGLVGVGCEPRAESGGLIAVRSSFGGIGLEAGQFSYPRSMEFVPGGLDEIRDDTVLVIDKSARVQRMIAAGDRAGEVVGGFRMPEWELGKPTGLTVGPHPFEADRRVLWIADTHYQRVSMFELPAGGSPDEAGKPILSFGAYGRELGTFIYPTDVALELDSSGGLIRAYVAEYGSNDRVQVFEPGVDGDGEPTMVAVRAIGGFGVAGLDDVDGGLVWNRPQDLEWDPTTGTLLVCDAINHRIVRVTADGTVVGVFGEGGASGRGLGELDHPYSLKVLTDGTVLVAEFGSSRVQHLDLEAGESLGSYGVPGRDPGELANPWEVVVHGREAWVLDSGNNRVVSFVSPVAGVAVRAVSGADGGGG